MSEAHVAGPALRIERGHADDEELAAVTTVLWAVLARRDEQQNDENAPGVPKWRPENPVGAYRSPYSWHGGLSQPVAEPGLAA
ncbi:hypothetical protein ABIA32_005991 [Streptacidiphilus sp. MAP12-20]|uniref:acyl-CoA carboxylase subunit epsilon n=1 Tax=Streptacidiphilus sp. MAP12-20 TaxID=3156299 RepID=UPI003513403E